MNLINFNYFLYLILLYTIVLNTSAQCTTGCDITTSATNVSTTKVNEVICITSTPSGNVNINLNHAELHIKVCADNVVFNSLNINSGLSNVKIETWNDNTVLKGVSIGQSTFSFVSHADNAVIESVTANERFYFQATNGGVLLLPTFTAAKGGTLLADTNSTLTVTGVTINGATDIITKQGATSNFNSNITFNNNANVINQGIMNITGNLTYQASSNTLDNSCGESAINISGTFDHDAGPIINGGLISANNVKINSGTSLGMIMKSGGRLVAANNLTSMNTTNYMSFDGPGSQCANFKITGISNWNNNLTSSSNIYYDGPASSGKQGSATSSTTDCANFRAFCNPILPVKWLALTASSISGGALINWSVLPDYESSGIYIIEYSYDFKMYQKAAEIYSDHQLIQSYDYDYNHYFNPTSNIVYYRIRYINSNGDQSISNTVVVNASIENQIEVYPNPITNNCISGYINIKGLDSTEFFLYDSFGKLIKSGVILLDSTPYFEIDISNEFISYGTYVVLFQSVMSAEYVKIAVLN